ncbi:thioredoxin family protein [Xanthobacter autotrophicus]|uniref:thioredoxin family protein n=1 Tax=Xanthobacter autotrophicus TaxID=280 RepID=UPI003728D668
MKRLHPLLAGLTCALVLLGSLSASAAERKPFDPAVFAAAQAASTPILVEISAPWCPTCKAQKPIIDALAAQPETKALVIFEVDFDTQKPVVRSFNAQSQSTLIAFRGKTETARSVGDTNPASIAALVKSSLAR